VCHLSTRTHPNFVLVKQHWVRSATGGCLLVAASLLPPAGVFAQGTGFTAPLPQVQTGTSAPPLSSASGQQNPFLGGVPSRAPTAGVLQLSLLAAIQRGLRYNLGLLLSSDQMEAARGARWKALSDLLPNLNTRISESAQQINLAALGLKPSSFPGLNPIVGPFGVFDVRAFLTTPVLDFHALERTRQESHNLEAATWNYRNARELVVLVAGGSYLQVLAAAARRDAAQAQFKTAQTLYNQAVDMKRAGMIAGIDVLRAQVEMQAQQQRLLAVSNDLDKWKLQLARVIGLPVAQQFELTDTVPFQPAPAITLDQALETAYKNRADYQAAVNLEHAAEAGKRAAEAERLPSLGINADYGDIGITPGNSHGTFTAAAALRIPIFQGGKVRGDVLQAEALLKQRQSEIGDLRSRIEFEVRTAFLDLKAAADLVEVAHSTMGLAEEQLRQAQDRFAAGVANNIDVVQAQESLATANENYISSLNSFNLAKLSLARALGVAETATQRYLGGTK
jgi:outer membrane protein TolC